MYSNICLVVQCLTCYGDAELESDSPDRRYCYNKTLVDRVFGSSRWYYLLSLGFLVEFVIVVVLIAYIWRWRRRAKPEASAATAATGAEAAASTAKKQQQQQLAEEAAATVAAAITVVSAGGGGGGGGGGDGGRESSNRLGAWREWNARTCLSTMLCFFFQTHSFTRRLLTITRNFSSNLTPCDYYYKSLRKSLLHDGTRHWKRLT